ncbi:hypothetical protein L2E82_03362 [Cichorium intybus]|uniref:Uncharacterized protein n=1 Tax=Cichorium intybus TaxID=13427 RepID=A0ACB9H3Q1_CICIN|nr:hypothetical protein L2E82_03362 [Cichorium intybus]
MPSNVSSKNKSANMILKFFSRNTYKKKKCIEKPKYPNLSTTQQKGNDELIRYHNNFMIQYNNLEITKKAH